MGLEVTDIVNAINRGVTFGDDGIAAMHNTQASYTGDTPVSVANNAANTPPETQSNWYGLSIPKQRTTSIYDNEPYDSSKETPGEYGERIKKKNDTKTSVSMRTVRRWSLGILGGFLVLVGAVGMVSGSSAEAPLALAFGKIANKIEKKTEEE